MAKRQLLFVTYENDEVEDGFSYAVELARAMYEDITLLLVRKENGLADRLGTLMTAVAFAEAGEPAEARYILSGEDREKHGSLDVKFAGLKAKCMQEGIKLDVRRIDQFAAPGIRSFLRDNGGIDKVVLSPALTECGSVSTRDLNRLVRTASRPVVTMTRQACAPA